MPCACAGTAAEHADLVVMVQFAKRRRIFQGPDLQKDEGMVLFG
jgi:hypothetical protein